MQHILGLARVLFASLFLMTPAFGAPIVNDSPRPSVTVPKTVLKPALGAEASDPAWTGSVSLPALTRSLGPPPEPSSLPETTVQLLWDADYLYVRFSCKDQEIYAPVHGRDAPLFQGDVVEIFIDPVGDARQWIELQFNADNDVLDQLFLSTAEPKNDQSLCLTADVINRDLWNMLAWNMSGLRSKAMRVSPAANGQNWIVDIAIPARELLRRTGLTQFKPMTLKGDFLRYKWMPAASGAKRELLPLNWSPVSFGAPHCSPAAYGAIILAE